MNLLQGFTEFIAVRKVHFLPLEFWIQIYCVGSKSFTPVPTLILAHIFFLGAAPPSPTPSWTMDSSFTRFLDRTQCTAVASTPLSSSQRPLPDSTQHLQQTNIHAHGGIRTHILSKRATTETGHISFYHSLFGFYLYRVIPERRLLW